MLAAEPEIFGSAGEKRAWLLGVTPEIVAVRWLREVQLVAIERVQAMIDFWWAGNPDSQWAVFADWARAPFADQIFDFVIGDGCLTVVNEADGPSRLLASLHRCLRRNSYLMLRLFCRPDAPRKRRTRLSPPCDPVPSAVFMPSSGALRWRFRAGTMRPTWQ